ncbi:MAG: secretin N-terminal domain-containing protein [Pirellulaceae bacterium]
MKSIHFALAAVAASLLAVGTTSAQEERGGRSAPQDREVKIFSVEKGNAGELADMLRELFPGGDRGVVQLAQMRGGLPGLSSLKVSVDRRTNSIVALGSSDELTMVETILAKLDEKESATPSRPAAGRGPQRGPQARGPMGRGGQFGPSRGFMGPQGPGFGRGPQMGPGSMRGRGMGRPDARGPQGERSERARPERGRGEGDRPQADRPREGGPREGRGERPEAGRREGDRPETGREGRPDRGRGPGMGRPGQSRPDGRAQEGRPFDPIDYLKRLDANGDGVLDESELEGRARGFVRNLQERLGMDNSGEVSIEKLTAELKKRQGRETEGRGPRPERGDAEGRRDGRRGDQPRGERERDGSRRERSRSSDSTNTETETETKSEESKDAPVEESSAE